MSARKYINVSVNYAESINLTLTEKRRDVTLSEVDANPTLHICDNKITRVKALSHNTLNKPSSQRYWHEHKSPSCIVCCREMSHPITQVLTVYSVPFIKVVDIGGNTSIGPNDIFISYLIFYNTGELSMPEPE